MIFFVNISLTVNAHDKFESHVRKIQFPSDPLRTGPAQYSEETQHRLGLSISNYEQQQQPIYRGVPDPSGTPC